MYAKENGFKNVKIFIDDGVSGATFNAHVRQRGNNKSSTQIDRPPTAIPKQKKIRAYIAKHMNNF